MSVTVDINQQESRRSLELTGPEPSISCNFARNEAKTSCRWRSPWENKGKIPAQTNASPVSVSNSDNSVWSTDHEHGDFSSQTPGEQKALEGTSHKLRRMSLMRNAVVHDGYNECMVHHYAYMMKVAEDCKPETYTEVAKDLRWVRQ